jgi:hypothetical protein
VDGTASRESPPKKEKDMATKTWKGYLQFGLLMVLFVPTLYAQDLSTTPMQVQRTFTMTVTTPFIPPKYETQVFATQDAQVIEAFIYCWNRTAKDAKGRVQCGRTWALGWQGQQRKDDPETYEFGWTNPYNGERESGLHVLTTTLIVVTNEHCVGAYVLKDSQAHGHLKLRASIACRASEPDDDDYIQQK